MIIVITIIIIVAIIVILVVIIVITIVIWVAVKELKFSILGKPFYLLYIPIMVT